MASELKLKENIKNYPYLKYSLISHLLIATSLGFENLNLRIEPKSGIPERIKITSRNFNLKKRDIKFSYNPKESITDQLKEYCSKNYPDKDLINEIFSTINDEDIAQVFGKDFYNSKIVKQNIEGIFNFLLLETKEEKKEPLEQIKNNIKSLQKALRKREVDLNKNSSDTSKEIKKFLSKNLTRLGANKEIESYHSIYFEENPSNLNGLLVKNSGSPKNVILFYENQKPINLEELEESKKNSLLRLLQNTKDNYVTNVAQILKHLEENSKALNIKKTISIDSMNYYKFKTEINDKVFDVKLYTNGKMIISDDNVFWQATEADLKNILNEFSTSLNLYEAYKDKKPNKQEIAENIDNFKKNIKHNSLKTNPETGVIFRDSGIKFSITKPLQISDTTLSLDKSIINDKSLNSSISSPINPNHTILHSRGLKIDAILCSDDKFKAQDKTTSIYKEITKSQKLKGRRITAIKNDNNYVSDLLLYNGSKYENNSFIDIDTIFSTFNQDEKKVEELINQYFRRNANIEFKTSDNLCYSCDNTNDKESLFVIEQQGKDPQKFSNILKSDNTKALGYIKSTTEYKQPEKPKDTHKKGDPLVVPRTYVANAEIAALFIGEDSKSR